MVLIKNHEAFKKQGFTLVELVIVIIVLGILTAVALPKLLGKSAFEDYTVKDQLIARLRLVQLQNMNADPALSATNNACYWVVTKSACFYSEHTARSAGLCATPVSYSSKGIKKGLFCILFLKFLLSNELPIIDS